MKALLQTISHSIHEGKLKCSNLPWLIAGSVLRLESFFSPSMSAFKYSFIFSPKSFPTCYLQSTYLVTDAVEIASLIFPTTPQRCSTN
jgi:hypothetical protein